MDFGELTATGQLGGNSGHGGNVASGGGGEMKLFPIEGASVDSAISTPALNPLPASNPDTMFASMNKGGGALGGTLDKLGGDVCNHLGASEAKGDNLDLTQLSQGDFGNIKAPTVQSDLQMKEMGMGVGGAGQGM